MNSDGKLTLQEISSEFSHHDPTVARINNGSFGCCPRSITAAQHDWQNQFLRQPDHFFLNLLQPAIANSRSLVASLVNARHVDEISLVDNATTAAAIFLQHCSWSFAEGRFSPGDAAVMLHYAYGAVKKSVEAYITRAGGHVIEVDLPFPVRSEEEIVAEFRNALAKGKEEGRRVRVAVIDHVTSMPTVVIPVKKLVQICREEGVEQVFVDAAHGIGCVDVDMQDIGADFYTSNLHKWFFCPPSVAFLYCRNQSSEELDHHHHHHHLNLHHPVVSHEYGNGLPVESGWIGTRDYSAQLVVPQAVEFVNRYPGGIEAIKARNHEAVVEMGEMLANAWGTHLGCPAKMCASMIMVGLPARLGIRSDSDALKLRVHLRDCFMVEIPIYFNKKAAEDDGVTGYVRVSHQVYNKVEDYHRLRDAVHQLVRDGFSCSSLPDSE
ncbi:Probable L-cysteine desulfhydrase, chloroplastic [Linum perenne]